MNILDTAADSKLFAPWIRLIEHGQVDAEGLKILSQDGQVMNAPGEAGELQDRADAGTTSQRIGPETIERGPVRFRPRNSHSDVHFGGFQAPGLGTGAGALSWISGCWSVAETRA